MSRSTSAQARDELEATGELSQRRGQVLGILLRCGPLTGAEVDAVGKGEPGVRGHLHKRLGELEGVGLVERVGTRVCKQTGRTATVWRVTDKGRQLASEGNVAPLLRPATKGGRRARDEQPRARDPRQLALDW